MKPWDDKETIKAFRRMSGSRSVEMACKLINFSLEILKGSIKTQHPHMNKKEVKKEMEKILWEYGL